MTRTQIINSIAKKINAQSYLEIGTREGKNFDAIDIEYKVGVDPDPQAKATFRCTSDEFFTSEFVRKFDIIFIDGLHEWEQVSRDILNSLDCLTDGGCIILHDCNPRSYESQLVPRQVKNWNGDVWRSIVDLRTKRNDLNIFVIDTDEGCGIIEKKKSVKLIINESINYENFNKNRKLWLNLIKIEDFLICLK